jgi:hypothetical protein
MPVLLSFGGPQALFFSFLFQEAGQQYYPGNNPINRHSRSASERESRLLFKHLGSPIKPFGDDEKNPGNRLITPVSIKFTLFGTYVSDFEIRISDFGFKPII